MRMRASDTTISKYNQVNGMIKRAVGLSAAPLQHSISECRSRWLHWFVYYKRAKNRRLWSSPSETTGSHRVKIFNSYFNRITWSWHSLPVQIRPSDSLNVFKSRQENLCRDNLVNSFQSNDICTGRSSCRCTIAAYARVHRSFSNSTF